jgi:hypothetical protein
VFDLAWPDGLQNELTAPVAVLIDETADVLGMASEAGYRCFTSVAVFKTYVMDELVWRFCQTNAKASPFALPTRSVRRRKARATLRERRRVRPCNLIAKTDTAPG